MENRLKWMKRVIPVLIGIILITLAMIVYNASKDSAEITLAETEEANEFNENFKEYAGEQSGTQVKALLSFLQENATTNKDENEKLPFIWENFDTSNSANILDGADGYIGALGRSLASNNIRAYRNKISKLAEKVSDKGTYRVKFEQDEEGYIEEIFITSSS